MSRVERLAVARRLDGKVGELLSHILFPYRVCYFDKAWVEDVSLRLQQATADEAMEAVRTWCYARQCAATGEVPALLSNLVRICHVSMEDDNDET